ncbi:MAG: tRNA uridine-5-carboxymethylaminomethyl(34) synthesis GTPase MnmE [Gammaproteobacteria bacterium]|nr:tRNA uridine-5-carboxymethylaminomethyl(34) synthesis GTPase MnmE [Gammaproteobacteria bacterium]
MSDTIAAIATPPGKGGVGIVRLSGTDALSIAQQICNLTPQPRTAHFVKFHNDDKIIDEGLILYFVAPHSFTGEDVVELQGHGGPVVMDQLLQCCLNLGARLAEPGEFSKRAFLNNKIDLTQAEAIADLIDAGTQQAAQNALHSLQGVFSEKINVLLVQLTQLRKMVEAAIDFAEEEIDFLTDSTIKQDLQKLIQQLEQVFNAAKQGALLREGMTIVIAGKPNAGKSSLLNCLTGKDSAIVTQVAGTTRDVLREYIHIDGLPLHIIDTAGLRESGDEIEQEGMRRAHQEIEKADAVLWIKDITDKTEQRPEILNTVENGIPIIVVNNKIDLVNQGPREEREELYISAKKNQGIDLLKQRLERVMGYTPGQEGLFTARRRHLDVLQRVVGLLQHGDQQLQQHKAGELLAEDLRLAQQVLSEITGEFSSDDLLGEIFGSFCVGK